MNVADVSLGILAGGRATRLGGIDKAWLQRDGKAQVSRIAQRFEGRVASLLVSANQQLHRHAALGLAVIVDTHRDIGPMGGLDALVSNCRTPWLLTVPVDLVDVNDCLLPTLWAHAGGAGAFAIDDDGPQPLVALWRVDGVHSTVADAISRKDFSMHALQSRLRMTAVRCAGVRFGNLNTPSDLATANIDASP
ncbi:molybdenum cofactor guanylyltransferase [Cognatiluteimonas profundi]|uniref:molybdenum cofactor guanylyltransferase n=1 Tax=Cognatiluteimonas profundi TaxID=2594501 RepID=UPI00131D020A|nr:molybdenum cofactor guanylyltransferase [Lysobacter profundi]